MTAQRVTTCLWLEHSAEQAAERYVGLFPNSRVVEVLRYAEGSPGPPGEAMTVRFELDGTEYLAMNGGPPAPATPAVSLMAYGETQAEVDELWDRLCDGGEPGRCGWLTDRFGLSWQVVPRRLLEFLHTSDTAASLRAFAAMMEMGKIDLAVVERAYRGD